MCGHAHPRRRQPSGGSPSHDHSHGCPGCSHAFTRRGFMKGCTALAASGALAAGGAAAMTQAGEAPKQGKVRVAVVFTTTGGREVWPYPKYDVPGRAKEVVGALTAGCPGVDFVPFVCGNAAHIQKIVAQKDAFDGFIVHFTMLCGVGRQAVKMLAPLGKPLVMANDVLGGGMDFLSASAGTLGAKSPILAMSSSEIEDLVAVARCFADVKKDSLSPATFAQRCREAYVKTFGRSPNRTLEKDDLKVADVGECIKRLQKTHFLVVGRGKPGAEATFLGVKGRSIGFGEFADFYKKADRDQAKEWAARWTREAEKVIDATPAWIENAAAVHLATLAMCKKYGTDTVTMDCLGGFASGKLPAYPCLGFTQMLNDGGHGVCEAQPDDTVSMLIARYLTGRAGYVSDPDIDTATSSALYAHCLAPTKVFGADGRQNPFRIRTLHNLDPRGTCVQSLMPAGYMTTSFRTNHRARQMVIHQARATGNVESERGCRSQLIAEVKGDIEKLFGQWNRFSWHRVTVYGDIKDALVELAGALKLKVVFEA